jgi:hypothetical protein
MIQRCLNPTCREYKYYGARGIKVCDRWLEPNGFAHFIADLGRRPYPRASFHRVDNDGNYEPRNVIWANARVQRRNTRANRVLTHAGKSLILVEWAEELNIKEVTLSQRLFKGWSVERTLTTPVEPRKPYHEWIHRNPNPRRRGRKPSKQHDHDASNDRAVPGVDLSSYPDIQGSDAQHTVHK